MRYWDGTQWTEHYAPAGGPQPPGTPLTRPPGQNRKTNRTVLLAVGGVILLVGGCAIGAASAGNGSDPGTSSTKTVTVTTTPVTTAPTVTVTKTLRPTATNTVTEPPPPPKVAFKGDGTFLVGKDIEAGTYRNSNGGDCYWERLSGLSGDFGDILANDNSSGPVIVTLLPTDKAFSVARCGSWSKVG